MVQRLFQDLTQYMNPLIGCTLHHTKLKGENFLQGIHFDSPFAPSIPHFLNFKLPVE
jgi:hypothetical protein